MIIINSTLGVKTVREFYNDLRNDFDRAVSEGGEVVLDFSCVKNIDLSAAQVLIAASRAAKKVDVPIKLKAVSPDVREQMQLCGIRI